MPTYPTRISRDLAAQYGEQAVRIIDAASYTAPSGRFVSIAAELAHAVRHTVSYAPDAPLPDRAPGPHRTRVEVVDETTLSAAARLLAEGLNPVALNFASATHPGGGFLNGALAQEEYLCRSSALYACLRGNPMYPYHRARHDALYTDYAIYSPAVPIFRGDDGALLEAPCNLAFITSPAANLSALAPWRWRLAGPAMRIRIRKVLSAGIRHDHDSIVLGAWGCGAFRNDPREIAALFRAALDDNFAGAYRAVIFAVLDWSPERRNIGPFEAAFAGGASRG